MSAFSPVAVGYFESHGIDPNLAASFGVAERDGCLIYTIHRPEGGGSFERSRGLNGNGPKTIQPKGEPLTIWWPRFPPMLAPEVLITEGDSDGLAAITALDAATASPRTPSPPGSISSACPPTWATPASPSRSTSTAT